jgi:hypothetical protein
VTFDSQKHGDLKCALQVIDGGYKNFEFVIHFI